MIEGDSIFLRRLHDGHPCRERYLLGTTTAFLRIPLTSEVDEDSAHESSRDAEEVRVVVRGEEGFRTGLFFSQTSSLTAKQETALLEGLRRWTGFVEIQPDDNGRVVLGDRARISGGSATARSLILGAVDGADSYTIESCYHSPEIAFARVQARSDYVNQRAAPGLTRHSWNIQLDFHDYQELRGQAEAISAFDPGLNLLHELAHAVMRLRDSTSRADPLGDCERFINRIRREMGLPERQSYAPVNGLAVTPSGTGRRLLGELTFVRVDPGKRTKKFRLTFDVHNVVSATQVGRRPLVWSAPCQAG